MQQRQVCNSLSGVVWQNPCSKDAQSCHELSSDLGAVVPLVGTVEVQRLPRRFRLARHSDRLLKVLLQVVIVVLPAHFQELIPVQSHKSSAQLLSSASSSQQH